MQGLPISISTIAVTLVPFGNVQEPFGAGSRVIEVIFPAVDPVNTEMKMTIIVLLSKDLIIHIDQAYVPMVPLHLIFHDNYDHWTEDLGIHVNANTKPTQQEDG